MKSYSQHVKSDRAKWFVVALALIVIAVILCGMLTSWFKEWNPFCWFGHKYDDSGICERCGAEQLDDVKPDDDVDQALISGGMLAEVADEDGIALHLVRKAAPVGASATAVSNDYTITATVKPEAADNKSVDWTIRWKNPDSAWAQGKSVTDYCTITPESDGALVATLHNVKDFGELIEVIATSRDNPEKQGTCRVNYVQKITGFTFNMPDVASETTSFTYEVETSAYTVASNIWIDVDEVILELTDGFRDYLEEEARFGTKTAKDDIQISFVDAYITANTSSKTLTIFRNDNYFDYGDVELPGLINYFVSIQQQSLSRAKLTTGDIVAGFRQAVNNVSGAHASFQLDYGASYNGTNYSIGAKTVEVRFDGSALHVPVEEIVLSDTDIYF